jgi:hypothetical protein
MVISTEVFEHVMPAVQRAFDGAARLLKSRGALVFTVPWRLEGETVEQYPATVDYEVIEVDDRHEVDILDASGSRRRVTKPSFHGGPRSTLEMRLFWLPDILATLAEAGFRSSRVLREDVLEFGIRHPSQLPLPLLARR